jgi:hypothetical protein
MPSGVRTLFQSVVDDVGPDDCGFENPAVGEVPAHARAKDAGEHVGELLDKF